MKFKFMATIFFAALSLIPLSALAVTFHDNDVYITLNGQSSASGLVSGSFLVKDFSITDKQDPGTNLGPRPLLGSQNNQYFEFYVGRKGSSKVANWFASRISSSQNTFDKNPGDLNFAFLGDLTLTLNLKQPDPTGSYRQTVVFDDIVLAQGHSGSTNNWWFGGKNCHYDKDNMVYCAGTATTGQRVFAYFWRGGNSSSDDIVNIRSYTIDPNFKPLTLDSPKDKESVNAPYNFSPYGSGTPGARVKVEYGPVSHPVNVDYATVNPSGKWNVSPHSLEDPGSYEVTASQSQDGGNTYIGSVTHDFTVMAQDPTTKITSPPDASWVAPPNSSFVVKGTVAPANDAGKIQCFLDGSRQGTLASDNKAGTWQCRYSAAAGKHSVSGRVKADCPANECARNTYVVANLLTWNTPASNTTVARPATLTGSQQDGATITYQSDCFGSGTAKSQGATWTIGPVDHTGACTFTVSETYQGMRVGDPVTRSFTVAAPVSISAPSSDHPAATNTSYLIAGSAQPGATVVVSLNEGWYPIASVTADPEGRWETHGPGSAAGDYILTVTETLNGKPLGTTEREITVTSDAKGTETHD